MKTPRYLLDYSNINFEKVYIDFLIIGTGIAGLYSAIHAHKWGKVLIVTKEKLEDSNTEHAQGGIAAVFDKEDSTELHLKDTLVAGAGLCNREAVQVLVNEGPARVRELIDMGTNFDRHHDQIALTREGAHSRRRILHAGGDATGEEVRRALTNVVVNQLGIPVHEKTFILDLITHEGRCYGALAYCHHYKKFVAYLAPITIVATGGCGQLYRTTSNPDVATGDGMAFAYRAGAELMDMEFIQFHPTTLYIPGLPAFLVSEAVRGEGAVLRNANGERFMHKYHPMAELAPRDVVARAIVDQMKKDGKLHVWLDITHRDAEFLKNRFPTIYKTCLKNGIDMAKDWLPVAPAAHYMMGGVRTDLYGATRIPGLFACGEVACTGVHGANRLASNSLLDGLVFGYRIFEKAIPEFKSFNEDLDKIPLFIPEPKYKKRRSLCSTYRKRLQLLMSEKVGIIRDEEGLKSALETLEDWSKCLEFEFSSMEEWETQNMIQIAYIMVRSALVRKESRGAHYRRDYPESILSYKGRHFVFQRESQESDSVELES
ncbi:L-aspartate oxidase [Anoxybacter fermentans]|uniref:L-aspartate oxidase n=1 Tax=Anoxybacter fermentans TaxID=1323375 RepID=A0A3Q9HSG4_9FIRM|nr:L-aspartate oxidase [Anoxybacter fermentans]AZR74659.1 L-aspartate oxidase [Anoxybacter fermentans]